MHCFQELASTVFAFDLADDKKRTPLLGVLQRHGIATTEELGKFRARLLEELSDHHVSGLSVNFDPFEHLGIPVFFQA